jgi:hypothetical protein
MKSYILNIWAALVSLFGNKKVVVRKEPTPLEKEIIHWKNMYDYSDHVDATCEYAFRLHQLGVPGYERLARKHVVGRVAEVLVKNSTLLGVFADFEFWGHEDLRSVIPKKALLKDVLFTSFGIDLDCLETWKEAHVESDEYHALKLVDFKVLAMDSWEHPATYCQRARDFACERLSINS